MRTFLPLLFFLGVTISFASPKEGSGHELARREESLDDPASQPPTPLHNDHGHQPEPAGEAEVVIKRRKSRPSEPIPGVFADTDWQRNLHEVTKEALCQACVTDCVQNRHSELRGKINECAQFCTDSYQWECYPSDNISGKKVRDRVAGGVNDFQQGLKNLRAPSWNRNMPFLLSPALARVPVWARG
ncbi:MAG: Dynamin- GTPase protein [Watsoniomyces obsoletus]|nr:MAG: Dynamin- GTPase protein [Watsoniomyces obsoletus]